MDAAFQAAVARYEEFASAGRLRQGTWRAEEEGHAVACALGAMYGVESVAACPADAMPAWLKHLIVPIFDNLGLDEAIEAVRQINQRVLALNGSDWSARVERDVKIAIVRQALASAEPVAGKRATWPEVVGAAEAVCEALMGRGDLIAARKRAAAAAAAAYAASAAADAAAYAAYAAAYAADAAASAAAARQRAWRAVAASVLRAWRAVAASVLRAMDAALSASQVLA